MEVYGTARFFHSAGGPLPRTPITDPATTVPDGITHWFGDGFFGLLLMGPLQG